MTKTNFSGTTKHQFYVSNLIIDSSGLTEERTFAAPDENIDLSQINSDIAAISGDVDTINGQIISLDSGKADAVHIHAISDITSLSSELNDKVSLSGGNIDGSLSISGNLTVNGTTFTSNTETVLVEDNLITLNANESGNGVTAGSAGIEIERGTATNYEFKFVESDDTFRIGETGSLQAVATREDSPTNGRVGIWDSTTKKFVTTGNASVNGSIQASTTTIYGDRIEINETGTGNRGSAIDFHGDDTYTDFGLRIIRNGNGLNSESHIWHRGTGPLTFVTQENGPINFYQNNTHKINIGNNDGKVNIYNGGLNVYGDIYTSSNININGTITVYSKSIVNTTTQNGIVINATTTDPVKDTNSVLDQIIYDIQFGIMTAKYNLRFSDSPVGHSSGSGEYLWNLPTGWRFTSSVMKSTTTNPVYNSLDCVLGSSSAFISSSTTVANLYHIIPYDNTRFRLMSAGTNGALSVIYNSNSNGAFTGFRDISITLICSVEPNV